MIIAGIVILGIILTFIVLNYRNKFIYVIALYFFSITATMVVAALYISKLSLYKFPLQADYVLYQWISKTNLHIVNISRLYNLCFGMFMASSVAFIKTIYKIKWWKTLLMLIPIFYFLIWNDASISWDLYLAVNTMAVEKVTVFQKVIALNKVFNEALVMTYMLIPYLFMGKYFMNTRIMLKRKYAIVSASCLTLINIFFYTVFMIGPFQTIRFDRVNLMKLPDASGISQGYIFVPLLLMLALMCVVYVTLHYKPYNSIVLIRKNEMHQNTKLMNKNMSAVLHIYKNAFICIQKFAELIDEDIGKNDAAVAENNGVIKNIATESSQHIQRTLNMLKDIHIKYTCVNMEECVNVALKKVFIPDEIRLDIQHTGGDYIVYGDSFHLTEALVNILKNAVEALNSKKEEQAIIKILLGQEIDFVFVEITDNGVGIDKKHVKSVFKPFFSTKSRMVGSGIGLNYVENVAQHHHGAVSVRTKLGKFTCLQLALPVYQPK